MANNRTVHEDELDQWVHQASQNRDAFGRLFDFFYPQIFAYCLRRLLVRAVAEDVASEIFLKVANAIHGFQGKTVEDFRRWIFRIATNEINAQMRKSIRRKSILETAVQMGLVGQKFSHQVLESDCDLRWAEVYQAIESLSERDQSILSLKFFGQQTYEEIADILEIEPRTARVALSRALGNLRKQLDSQTNGDPITVTKGEGPKY
jgi:RNA polymerase sigma-70 factor (ECF subfamily)